MYTNTDKYCQLAFSRGQYSFSTFCRATLGDLPWNKRDWIRKGLHCKLFVNLIILGSHLEQRQEEQGERLVNRGIHQSLGQEQEEPPEANIVIEESLHRRVEVVRHTAPKDQAEQSIGEDALLVQRLGARQTL